MFKNIFRLAVLSRQLEGASPDSIHGRLQPFFCSAFSGHTQLLSSGLAVVVLIAFGEPRYCYAAE